MNRQTMLTVLQQCSDPWDIIVIGGGATGLGVAVDAASRGYATLLLEQHDFAKGTSSRSTKLIHGGVRYLQQGNISLVLEALHERGLLIQNAPHLVSHQSFIVPSYEWWEGPFYGVGLKVYDLLAGKLGLAPSRRLSREETLSRIPTLEPKGLRGGVMYYDGQFDDARLAISLALTAADHGAVLLNYMKVEGVLKSGGVIEGVQVRDQESGQVFEIPGRVVVNATGVFADAILQMDDPEARRIIAPSQGVHLVLDKAFLRSDSAILVPHTADGRVLFAVPWHDRVVVGTTDTPVEEPTLEPLPLEEEIDFILEHAARYLTRDPTRTDVLSVFAGLRPLVSPEGRRDTAEISRDHHLVVSSSGLVTIAGGKWTTYRKMAEDTVDQAILVGGLPERPCRTRELPIHGWKKPVNRHDPRHVYGTDEEAIRELVCQQPELGEPLHPRLPYLKAEVVHAVRQEMARTVEDVLSRRTRALLLDAHAAMEAAPITAHLMAEELGWPPEKTEQEVEMFCTLARGYVPG